MLPSPFPFQHAHAGQFPMLALGRIASRTPILGREIVSCILRPENDEPLRHPPHLLVGALSSSSLSYDRSAIARIIYSFFAEMIIWDRAWNHNERVPCSYPLVKKGSSKGIACGLWVWWEHKLDGFSKSFWSIIWWPWPWWCSTTGAWNC